MNPATPAVEVSASIPTYTLNIIRANKVEKKAIAWLWPGRIPLGKTSVFNGYPGEGKSLATCSLIACVTTGKVFPDGGSNDLPPSDVLILSTEDDPSSVLVPRLEAAGANTSRVLIMRSATGTLGDREIALDRDREEISKYLLAHPDIRLFVIDPITNHMGEKNFFKDTEVRALLKPLESSGVTNLIVGHLNKSTGASAGQRMQGSVAFIGLARAAYLFVRHGDCQHMLLIKNNYARPSGLRYTFETVPISVAGASVDVPRILWLGKSDVDPDIALDPKTKVNEKQESSKVEAACQFLLAQLADGPMGATECKAAAKDDGISEHTLRRAREKLELDIYVDGETRRSMWKLPPVHSFANPFRTPPPPVKS